jgi:hypothetical protein
MVYRLEPLTTREVFQWDDLIKPFGNRYLFHRKPWLEYLSASQNVEIRFWAIREGSETVGYFCGGIVRKGPYRILGSPLKGWCTNYMGPVLCAGFDQDAFFQAIDELARREQFAMVEMEQPALSTGTFARHGFEAVFSPNIVLRLDPKRPDRMWERLNTRVRTKVRKARKSGLTAMLTMDPSIADVYFEQLSKQLLTKEKVIPQYGRETPALLCKYLMPRDLLFAIDLRDAMGETVATGLFPHDEETIYGWGRSSRPEAWPSSPNELLEWSAVELAASRGLKLFNMCTSGRFSSKFGGDFREAVRWHKFYLPSARLARYGYEMVRRQQIRVSGWWEHLVQRTASH